MFLLLLLFLFNLICGFGVAYRVSRMEWGFALTYAVGFLVGIISVYLTKDIYQSAKLSTLLLGCGSVFFAWNLRTLRWYEAKKIQDLIRQHSAFFVFLFIYVPFVLLWQKAYVEIPADPVGVHLFRIADWLRYKFIEFGLPNNSVRDSSLYLGYLIASQPFALMKDNISAAIEWVSLWHSFLFCGGIYLTAFFFFKDSLKAVCAVVLAQLTLGISVYSYLRYYPFAPGMLNMMLVLGCLTILAQHKNTLTREWKPWLFLLTAFAICFFTHKQEGLFILTQILFTFLFASFRITNPIYYRSSRWVFIGLFLLGTGSLLLLAYKGYVHQFGLEASEEFLSLGQIGQMTIMMANPFTSNRVTQSFGGGLVTIFLFNFLGHFWRYRKMGLETWLQDSRTFYFYLSLVPILIVFFPPFATAYFFLFYNEVFYRIIYSSFYFFPFIDIFFDWKTKKYFPAACLIAIIAISTSNYSRLPHFFYHSNAKDSYAAWTTVYETIKGLPMRREQDSYCKETCPDPEIYTDPITAHSMPILSGRLSTTCYYWRCYMVPTHWAVHHSAKALWEELYRLEYAVINLSPNFTKSRFAAHWPEDIRDLKRYYDPKILEWMQLFETKNLVEKIYDHESVYIYRILSKEKSAGDL